MCFSVEPKTRTQTDENYKTIRLHNCLQSTKHTKLSSWTSPPSNFMDQALSKIFFQTNISGLEFVLQTLSSTKVTMERVKKSLTWVSGNLHHFWSKFCIKKLKKTNFITDVSKFNSNFVTLFSININDCSSCNKRNGFRT